MIKSDTKTIFLADAKNAREKFLRRQRAIKCGARRKAVVTRAAAVSGKFLPKIRQQFHAAASRTLGVVNHLLQLFTRNLAFLRIWFFVNENGLFHCIARTEKQNTFARQPVATRAAGLLIIAFNVFRQIVVNNEADVRFVDAHAERDGRADDADVVAQK